MTLQIGGAHLYAFFPLPDITHHAAAIAPAVRVQHQDWQLGNCFSRAVRHQSSVNSTPCEHAAPASFQSGLRRQAHVPPLPSGAAQEHAPTARSLPPPMAAACTQVAGQSPHQPLGGEINSSPHHHQFHILGRQLGHRLRRTVSAITHNDKVRLRFWPDPALSVLQSQDRGRLSKTMR